MNPATPKTETPPSSQLRMRVLRGAHPLLAAIALTLWAGVGLVAQENGRQGLVGNWRLTTDARDESSAENHGGDQKVRFMADGAVFDGRASRIEVPD